MDRNKQKKDFVCKEDDDVDDGDNDGFHNKDDDGVDDGAEGWIETRETNDDIDYCVDDGDNDSDDNGDDDGVDDHTK
eukprot:15079352-Ditylum_brightwellii.AAC.1